MPEQDDDIFEFDPTSFWKELSHYEGIDYVYAVNQDTGAVVLVPASELKTQSEPEVIKKIDKFHYQYNFFKNNLQPEKIKQIAQWLREKSNLLSLVANQLAFHLLKLYEHLLKVHLKKAQGKLDPHIPTFTKILDEKGNLTSVKLNLDEAQTNQIIEYLKQDFAPRLDISHIWEEMAQEVLISHAISATERMKEDNGTEAVKNLDAESRWAAFEQYFGGEKAIDNAQLGYEVSLIVQRVSQQVVSAIFEGLDLPNLTLVDLDGILRFREDNTNKPIPVTKSRLTNAILPIPTFAAFASAITAQIRKDLWGKDRDGIARFKHQAKGNPKNYIEHYISSPGDIEILPWEQAEQIIDKFGFNTVKLHLIFAAHTMNQPVPWSGKFSLKASDVIKYLGWDKRTDLPVHQKLKEIAKAAFVLDCLLVKSVWVEGRNKKGEIDASTPTGRMWNVVVDPRGQLNINGQVEKPKEVYITVQPGLIFHSFLNKAGSK
ncbi:MAG: hypothetical protein SWZ49_25480, partial [Cyanobacteriota bacterium]|nr:hypothetical protein [Cyanobacteriota bacterium]